MNLDKVKRHDNQRKPCKENFLLKCLFVFLSFLLSCFHPFKVKKIKMKELKEPHLILLNHTSMADLKFMVRMNKNKPFNYVMAIDAYLDAAFTHLQEFIMRHYGGIIKRKFTNDFYLIRQIRYALKTNKHNVVMYPEARFCLSGTFSSIPESLGKLIKVLDVPVVTMQTLGTYISQPCWSDKVDRNAPVEVTIQYLLTKEQIKEMNYQEINQKIIDALDYNDFDYQLERGIKIKYKKRAEGLNHILYQCPHCLEAHNMYSHKDKLWCGSCKHEWSFLENGKLQSTNGETYFDNIPDWFEWERENVRQEIIKGEYSFSDDVMIYALPNAKGLIPIGIGHLTHDMEKGFHLTGDFKEFKIDITREPISMYSCHVEYNFWKHGECLDISTLDDTFFVHPLNHRDCLTKFHFATEEIFKIVNQRLQEENKNIEK